MIVLLFGAAIMLISNIFFNNDTSDEVSVFNSESEQTEKEQEVFGQSKPQSANSIADYEKAYEAQIKEALDTIVGVDDVSIVVNVDSTEKKVLEKIQRIKDKLLMRRIEKVAKGWWKINRKKNRLSSSVKEKKKFQL